jgi:hypothetical protein
VREYVEKTGVSIWQIFRVRWVQSAAAAKATAASALAAKRRSKEGGGGGGGGGVGVGVGVKDRVVLQSMANGGHYMTFDWSQNVDITVCSAMPCD